MKRNRILFVTLLLALLLAFLASLCLGASGLSPLEVVSALCSMDGENPATRIFWFVRLPRALAAVVTGTTLSISGMLLQSVLRNPLAAPSVIGINSGAGLCALLSMTFLPTIPWLVPFSAFTGACLAAFAVYLLARLTCASPITIVLSGVAVNAIFGAIMDAIVTLFPDAITGRSAFSIGVLANTTLRQLGFVAPLCILGLLMALMFQRELSVMELGDEVAHGLGMRVERWRAISLITAAMLAGCAVSLAGLLSFVGLIAPHAARLLCGKEECLRMPIAAVLGAVLCLLCDLLARLLFAPFELPVGVVLSLLGSPFFLILLLNRRKGNSNDAT